MTTPFKFSEHVKLVIWDLDDTFWTGTLSEEGITLIEENARIVRELVDRGIMSSIVSKNDPAPVRQILTDAGLLEYFIFPKVSWSPKGSQIQEILDQVCLRPDNVVFIDDNALNIEEARFRFPTMMIGYPDDVIPLLLNSDKTAGKDDRGHSRLAQYKQLEKKAIDRQAGQLDNVEFLRQSDITVRFDFDVEGNLDRIVELLNRSNQLNYTKGRLNSASEIAEFNSNLNRHDIVAAGIFASDKYGSHGLIGFYMQQRNERRNRLLHYVWSCRMMNAGLEQYVYERLGSPAVDVVEPVSNPITVFDSIDWIRETTSSSEHDARAEQHKVLLLGSCDLTAVASYTSRNRVEYVNGINDEVMTRYDDFGFILANPNEIAACDTPRDVPIWPIEDAIRFRDDLADSDILILSLSAAMKGFYLTTADGVCARVHPEGLGHHIDFNPRAEFLRGVKFYALSVQQKLDLLLNCLDTINGAMKKPEKRIFLLGANTRTVDGEPGMNDLKLLHSYNAECERFCEGRPGWHYVSIDDVVPYKELLDGRHYTRLGYLNIAQYINRMLQTAVAATAEPALREGGEPRSVLQAVQAGRRVSRLRSFGNRPDGIHFGIKQVIKMTPMGRAIRRFLA